MFTYTNADYEVSWAKNHGQIVRGHTLGAGRVLCMNVYKILIYACFGAVWHGQLPSWVTSGGFGRDELISIMQNHIANVAGRYVH